MFVQVIQAMQTSELINEALKELDKEALWVSKIRALLENAFISATKDEIELRLVTKFLREARLKLAESVE